MLVTVQGREKKPVSMKNKGPFWFCRVGCSDMGCHIDGFIAVVAHTHVLQDGPVTGRAADVIAAANTAAEVALRLLRPGRKVIHSAVLKLFHLFLFYNIYESGIVVCLTYELVYLSY